MGTPSERLISAASRGLTTIDGQGRQLVVKRADALDRLRLFKAVGADLSLNTPYLGMALLAASVTSIDGVPVPPPITEDQLESLVRRLGDAGISAVAQLLDESEHMEPGAADPGNLAGTLT